MILRLDLTNTATNDLTYSYQGYVEFWLVNYSSVSEASDPGEFLFKKLLGYATLDNVDQIGRASLEISNDLIESVDVGGIDYVYIEARYYLDGEELTYSPEGLFVSSNEYYFRLENPPQDEESFFGTFADNVADLLPDLHKFTLRFVEEGELERPLGGLTVSGKIYDGSVTPVLLKDLGTFETDSSGIVTFEWVNLANQATIKVAIQSYSGTPEFTNVLTSSNDEQAKVVVSATTVAAERENIVPGASSSTVFTQLGITPSTELNDFINDVTHPLTTLREVRKGGYLPDLSGYSSLSQTDKDNLSRLQAQAHLNLLYFPESHSVSITKYIAFNDLLYTDGTNPVKDATDIITKFSSGDFVIHGRTLRSGMSASDQPSDFALAAIYALSQKQFQLHSNFLSAAAADLKYKNGTNAGSTVFSGSGHTMDCECEECMTAVSPLSYLSSLITYAEQNVNDSNGAKATITGLTDFLKQPLKDLTLDCDEVSKRLCNFRVQVESLYKYNPEAYTLNEPLDEVTGYKAAYGFRKLRSGYSGSAIRVRRSSDNSESDIGFLNGKFDYSAFQSFIGAGTGYCVKLYDQSGNNQHLQETNTSYQAEIKFDQILNLPYLDLNGNNRLMLAVSDKPFWKFLHDGTGGFTFGIVQIGDNSDPQKAMYLVATTASTTQIGSVLMYDDIQASRNNAVLYQVTRGSSGNPSFLILQNDVWSANVAHQVTSSYNNDAGTTEDAFFRMEGSTIGTANTNPSYPPQSGNAAWDLTLFGRPDSHPSTLTMVGRFYEILFYGDLSTTNRDILEQNQLSYLNTCSRRIFHLGKAQYLQAAYQFLLNYIGTDFYELKNAQTDSDAEIALAERLGIPYIYQTTDNPVIDLFFDITVFDDNLSDPLGAAFTAGIATLETLLEDIFGIRKDSTDPLISLGDCDYVLWRREFVRVSFELSDNPENEWLANRNYYLDPDTVNADDLRYPVDTANYPVVYESALPDTLLVLDNRKKWSFGNETFLTQSSKQSVAGFIQGTDKIITNLAKDANAKFVEGTQVIISGTGPNAGFYKGKPVSGTTNFEIELSDPLPKSTLDLTAKIRFEIGYEISSYDSVNAEVTIVQGNINSYSGTFIRFYNPVNGLSRVIRATKIDNDTFAYDSSQKASIEASFPTADTPVIYFQIETGVDQTTPISLGTSKVYIFKDSTTDFTTADIEFDINGSELNDGSYESSGASTLINYAAGSYIDFSVDILEIPVKRTGLSTSQKGSITGGSGDGKLSYKKSGGTIAYYSNGYKLTVNANDVPLEANDILKDDEILLNENGTSVFDKVTIANVDDVSGTNDTYLTLQEQLPANYLALALAGGFNVKILINVAFVDATHLQIDDRDLTGFAVADVEVFDVSDFTSPLTVTNLTYTAGPPEFTTVEATGANFQSGTQYVLAIKNVSIKNVTQTGPFFKLAAPIAGLSDLVSEGIKVEVYSSTPALLGTFTAEEANIDDDIIYVSKQIIVTGYSTLSFYPELPVVSQFTRFAHKDGSDLDIFSELATSSNSKFRYSSVIGTTVDTDPTVWSAAGNANFISAMEADVALIKAGSAATLPGATNLSDKAFVRLTELFRKHFDYLKNPSNNENLSVEEVREIDTLLRLSIKNAIIQSLAWNNEEDELLLTVQSTYPDMIRLQDPRLFQFSSYAPKITDFEEHLYYDPTKPYLDGQFPLLAKVPGSRIGETARGLISQRETSYSWSFDDFADYIDTYGVDSFFMGIWSGVITSSVSNFFNTLYNKLYSTDPAVVSSGQQLLSFLGLDQTAFEQLRGLREEWIQKKQLPEAAGIRDQIVSITASAYKTAATYPHWLAEEKTAFTASSYFNYWKQRQENLIPWLTSAELRSDWIKAITSRQGYVAVDPDLLDIKYLKDITSTDPTIRAFTLMKDRLDDLLDWITITGSGGTLPTPPAGANTDTLKARFYAEYFLAITDTNLQGLFDALDLGEDVSAQLAQLACTPAQFYRIKALIESINPPGITLADVEEELLDILLVVRKVRTYCEWRDNEVFPPTGNDVPVVISPEFFKEPVDSYGLAQNVNESRRWRFDEKQLQVWRRLFKARTMIWKSIDTNAENMLSEADDATMIILRNAYIELRAPEADSSGNKYSFEQKQEILSDRLLQDFAVACCSPTTHVSTAISTLQRFFYILKTETDSVKYPVLGEYTLNAPYFDKEWKWLGSYGSFRSAMFVYIYPENLLHPALRRQRTPKFAEILNRMNEGGVFTPDTACKIANEYREYLTDVSNMNPQAGANCLVLDKAGPCADKSETGLKKVFFGFGKGGYYNRIYYTRHEVDATNSECFNWTELKQFGENIVRIIGACPAKKADGKRYLYVFAELKEKGKSSCVFLKYDLDELVWDEEYSEMEFPEGTEMSSVVMLQRHQEHLPVLIFLKTVQGVSSIWLNMISQYNDDWNWEDPIAIGPGREFHGYKPVDAIEVKASPDTTVYPFGDIVLVYQDRWDGYIVLQPFTVADPQYHFYQLNGSRLRPGQLFGIGNDFKLFEVNSGSGKYLTEGDLSHGIEKSRSSFGKLDYKGCYCYGDDSNRGLAVLVKQGSNPATLIRLDLVASTRAWNLSTIDSIYQFLFTYYNIGIGNAWVKIDDWYADLYELLVFCLGWNPSFSTQNPTFQKWWDSDRKEFKTNQTAYYAKRDKIRSGIGAWIQSEFDNREDNPTWISISYYLLGFFELATSGPVSAPSSNRTARPGIMNVLNLCIDGGNKKDTIDGNLVLKRYYNILGNSDTLKEFKISYVSHTQASNVTHLTSNSFLPQTQNISLGWKNKMPVLFKYNNSTLTSISTSFTETLLPTTGYNGPITSNKNSLKFQQYRIQLKNFFLANQTQCHIMLPFAEAYYFLPVLFGLKLHEAGCFEDSLAWFRAVYDYNWKTLSERKIWYGLVNEEANNISYNLSPGWLRDPLNPHYIVETRAGAYTAYTIQSIVKCLLDYGDQQFTIDTVESISLATHLYEEVEDLMELEQFTPSSESCSCGTDTATELWDQLRCLTNIGLLLEQEQAINELTYLLDQVESCTDKDALIAAAASYFTFGSIPTTEDIYSAIATFKNDILAKITLNPAPSKLQAFLTNAVTSYNTQVQNLLKVSGFNQAAEAIATASMQDVSQTYQLVTGYDLAALNDTANSPLSFTVLNADGPSGTYTQGTQVFKEEREVMLAGGNAGFSLVNKTYEAMPLMATQNESKYEYEWGPGYSAFAYCIPDNPVYESNRLRVKLNLFKIRNCFNIAGMKRELDPYAAPTDATTGLPSIGAGGQLSIPGQLVLKPTQYRYPVLIQRAKELVQQAQQLESVYLSSLEKKDAETYTLMKAKQDLKLSKANVKLSDLKVKVSEGEVDLAKLQMERSQIQVQELNNMIQAGLNQFEQQLIGAYMEIMIASVQLASLQGQLSLYSAVAGVVGYGTASAAAAGVAMFKPESASQAISYGTQAIQSGIQASYAMPIANVQKSLAKAQGQASVLSLMASLENRQREWQFQKVLGEQDIKIGQQQVRVAQDRLRVSGQELKMAEMQQTFAEDSMEFLRNKFTNAELYTWMSRVLAAAYSTMLNEATAIAKLAMYQLMFDRQQQPPVEIADNYWEAPSMDVSLEQTTGPDRRGITGSYRLGQDITRMDGWAFTTDTRKIEVSKTISLARMFPMEFQEFRSTGRITFNTLMEHFDRDFPGQYMRIIRKVTTNVIALVPPTEGIKATLSSSGISEVVIKGDRFQSTFIRRTPERIAISNPTGGTGMLELQPQGEQFFNPFEGNGVAMQWEFELPIESNFLDYSTISDVLITIQYTALDSPDYRNEVIRKLPKEYEGERLYSLRNDFSDQFYELSHPEDSANPFRISFDTLRFDFPGNLKDYFIRGLRIMLVANSQKLDNPDPGEAKQVGIEYKPYQANDLIVGNAILGANNFAGTIGQGGSGLQNFIGQRIDGTWTLDFAFLNNAIGGNTPQNLNPLKQLFEEGEIADILFVVDFGAKLKNQ